MSFTSLRSFIAMLEKRGELVRIQAEVSSNQEIALIQHKVLKAGGPALLFENVKGSRYRVASNVYGTAERVRRVFDREPAEIGAAWAEQHEEFLSTHTLKTVENAPVLENLHEPASLMELPVLRCCPLDGGDFLTLPLVHTEDPASGVGNLGIYRMQRYGNNVLGMHWNRKKGGGLHFKKATALAQSLPVSVALGGPPALTLAAVASLPEGMDERLFASWIMGEPLEVIHRKSTGHRIPSEAEFLIEGHISAGDERREGPFGDHIGHYSYSGDCPVFRVDRMWARNDAIYTTTVVGQPPQEDFYIGNALQEMSNPLLKKRHPFMADLWSFAETGFQPLVAIAIKQNRLADLRANMNAALADRSLASSKLVIVVDEEVRVRDFYAISRALRKYFDPAEGMLLDADNRLMLGATRKGEPLRPAPASPPRVTEVPREICRMRAFGEGVLMVQVEKGWNRDEVRRALQSHPVTKQYVIQVAVSADVDIDNDHLALWGWLTRCDPAIDIFPKGSHKKETDLPLFFDATWKEGYRRPIEFDPTLQEQVERRWNQYGIDL